jgi:hypothetical protein
MAHDVPFATERKKRSKSCNLGVAVRDKAKKVVRLTASSHTVQKLFAFARRVTLGIRFIVIIVR